MMMSVLVAESAWIVAPASWPETGCGVAGAPVMGRDGAVPTGREPRLCWFWPGVPKPPESGGAATPSRVRASTVAFAFFR